MEVAVFAQVSDDSPSQACEMSAVSQTVFKLFALNAVSIWSLMRKGGSVGRCFGDIAEGQGIGFLVQA
jgi:hypothetical protein